MVCELFYAPSLQEQNRLLAAVHSFTLYPCWQVPSQLPLNPWVKTTDTQLFNYSLPSWHNCRGLQALAFQPPWSKPACLPALISAILLPD